REPGGADRGSACRGGPAGAPGKLWRRCREPPRPRRRGVAPVDRLVQPQTGRYGVAAVALRGGVLRTMMAMRKLSILLSLLAATAVAQAPAVPPSPGGVGGDGREGQGVRGWTMFRGDPQQTGRAAGELPADLKPLWTFKAAEGISSTAAIADGSVFVGSLDGTLYSLDLATGALRWKHKTEDEIKSSPSVKGGVVYFGDAGGKLHALDAKTGKVRWTFQSGGEINSSVNFAAGCILFGSYDQSLYCVAERDGKVVWKVETDGYVHGTPAVVSDKAGETVVSTGCDGQLRVVRARDGKGLRQVEIGDYVAASPAVAAGRAFAGTFGNQVVAVDLGKGTVAWRYEHPVRKFPYYSSAALAGDAVVIGGRDKMIHSLNAANGKEIWAWSARAAIDASPVIAGTR